MSLAVVLRQTSAEDPVRGLALEDRPEPAAPDGWVHVTVQAASLNQHDLWMMRGAVPLHGPLPTVVGMDAVGVTDDGEHVIVHAVLGDAARGGGDETLDPNVTVLPDAGHGTLAERIVVPRANLVGRPTTLDPVSAACLPTAWLTAYRMLFTRAGGTDGDVVLIQGAGGAVSTAVLLLARACGMYPRVVTRDPERAERALALGAQSVHLPGQRLPRDADIVIDSVGEATWSSSLAAARPGGRIVTCGATSGFVAGTNLGRVFAKQLHIMGSTMGTRQELEDLVALVIRTGIRPVVDSVSSPRDVIPQYERLLAGQVFGKLVVKF